VLERLRLHCLRHGGCAKCVDLICDHDEIQVQTHHRFGVGIDGQAADNAVGSVRLRQQCQRAVKLPT
jgi:hypothetical protein